MRKRRFTAIIVVLGLLIASPAWAASVTLTWTDNSSKEDGFTVGRKLIGQPWKEIAEVAANVTTYKDETSQEGACYVILAFNQSGKSGLSNIACKLPPPPVVDLPPSEPSDLKTP